MNPMHQYMLDNYRAAQWGGRLPPQPGLHDWQVMRELRDYRHVQAVLAGHPVHGRLRAALTRLLHPRRPGTTGCH
ncbi:hypothetical protein SLUN_22490 [Streptomyces lunaelactis]|uniref:Uncharacterized protein n=1 Tax=Streptomyces lunaelactis TaxID=1535768 RepID=A0A2R4T5U3_9ACTN|nr:hypothetical protein [Streptomyces lunaelactis]AVZ74520.1 hypothetical protein SLUN_22490 [Streptomyces lunaelactis]